MTPRVGCTQVFLPFAHSPTDIHMMPQLPPLVMDPSQCTEFLSTHPLLQPTDPCVSSLPPLALTTLSSSSGSSLSI